VQQNHRAVGNALQGDGPSPIYVKKIKGKTRYLLSPNTPYAIISYSNPPKI